MRGNKAQEIMERLTLHDLLIIIGTRARNFVILGISEQPQKPNDEQDGDSG